MQIETKKCILAIDDDVVILNILGMTLRKDYDVILVTNGEDALKVVERRHIDLILLDIYMPGLNGFELADKLQLNMTFDTPIIFLTGMTEENLEVEAFLKKAVDFITKPVNPRILLSRVKNHLELASYKNNLQENINKSIDKLMELSRQINSTNEVSYELLANITDFRNKETGEHIARTSIFVKYITDYLLEHPVEGYIITKEEAEIYVKASKLHDIGKVGVPDYILLKKGRLTEEEFAIIKLHASWGEEIFKNVCKEENVPKLWNTAMEIAKSHHEKWNGTGYPLGLRGSDIPLSGRIMALADVYDALTSVRPYKKAFSHEESMDIIIKDKGIHFDPYLTDVFVLIQE